MNNLLKGEFMPSNILADDRIWDISGWGKRARDGLLHWYPEYSIAAACNDYALNHGIITRPRNLYPGDYRAHRYYPKCSKCQSVSSKPRKRLTMSAWKEW